MVFVQRKYLCWKKEIRQLLRKRLDLRDRVRYHKNKIIHHKDKIKEINKVKLVEVEKELESYLKKAGHN